MTDALRVAAERQLRANLRRGVSSLNGKPYSFCVPSNITYPFQWSWDSCFHAIVWSHLDIELAKEELRTLLRAQRRSGRIPHRIAWEWPHGRPYPYRFYLHSTSLRRPNASRLVQPPLIAQAIEAVFQRSNDRGFLEETVPAAERFYRWLAANRDPDGDGLVSIIHPYESGLDHKPSFDLVFGIRKPNAMGCTSAVRVLDVWNRALGYNLKRIFRTDKFNVEEVLFNCVYAQGLAVMAHLWKELGDAAKATEFESWSRGVEAAVRSKTRGEDGLYYDLYSRSEKKARVKTVTSLFPLILDGIPKREAQQLVRKHLLKAEEFWTPYPVPTVAADERSFEPSFKTPFRSGLWRGPTWVSTNWFLVHGLFKHGYADEAKHITNRTRQLIERRAQAGGRQAGFREFYNPYTGKAYGAPGFGWSTLIVDMVAAIEGA
ncbi:MAG TPA: trehalase family glycosidase [Dehalococcoidia bacterium]|jgi:glycogen debranching enzyme|nr:trehalase family glycosidase [Dehalococcoidia bacterium]